MGAQVIFKRGFTYRVEFNDLATGAAPGSPGAVQQKTLSMENDSIFILSRILLRHNDGTDSTAPACVTIVNQPLFLSITDLQSGDNLFSGISEPAIGLTPEFILAGAIFGNPGFPVQTYLPHVLSAPLTFSPNSTLLLKAFIISDISIPFLSLSFIGTKHYLR